MNSSKVAKSTAEVHSVPHDDHVDGVRLRLWIAATNGPTVHPSDYMSIENYGGMI
jgi:hypothetical protein